MVGRATSGEHKSHPARELSDLVDLASDRSPDVVGRTLAAAREQLGMDVAFVAEFSEGRLAFRSVEGDDGSFGFEEGGSLPLEGSYCRRLVDGRIPGVIPDAREDERVNRLEITRTADIGSYVGVPLRFSDGKLYGTLCCLSHSPDPSLRERDARFVGVLARMVAEQLEREELEATNRRLAARAAGIEALVAALEARDGYTGEHSRVVVGLSAAVARRLGLPGDKVEEVERVALLHDVGKIGVPDPILRKPAALDAAEWSLMRQHPEIGEKIVASMESLAHLAPAIRAEHERWDGRGYPDGLSGEEIPLASRIVLACDAFHSMTSDRPYRKACGDRAALSELEKEAGRQFDPRVVRALVEVLDAR